MTYRNKMIRLAIAATLCVAAICLLTTCKKTEQGSLIGQSSATAETFVTSAVGSDSTDGYVTSGSEAVTVGDEPAGTTESPAVTTTVPGVETTDGAGSTETVGGVDYPDVTTSDVGGILLPPIYFDTTTGS